MDVVLGVRKVRKGSFSLAPATPSVPVISSTLLLIIYLSWSYQQQLQVEAIKQATPSQQHHVNSENVTNPLIYKKHRFEDNFLQVWRRYQKHLTIDEKRESFMVNEWVQENETKLVEYTYFVNDQVDVSSITQDDIIFEALDRSYMSRLYPFYMNNYDNKSDIIKASDRNKVSTKRCDKEMNFMMERVGELQRARPSDSGVTISNALNFDVLAMFDSVGHEEAGLLLGNYYWIGNWRQCVRSEIFHKDNSNVTNSVNFRARYCIASLRSKRWDKIAQARVRELEEQLYFKYDQQKYDYVRFHRIQVGVCLPESCDSRLLDRRPEDLHKLVTLKLSDPIRSYDLVDLYCLPDETSEFRKLESSSWWFLYCLFLWLFALAVATMYDYRSTRDTSAPPTKPKTVKEKLINSLSLIKNYDRLTETKSCQPLPPPLVYDKEVTERRKLSSNDLLFLNCIKVLTNPIIISAHISMMRKHMDRYVLDYECLSKMLGHFSFSAVFFVDWFFVIAAFITSYVLFATRRVERNNLRAWIGAIIHRYQRLAPLNMVVFWFSKSLFKHTGHGPLWDYGTSNMTLRSICRQESFLYPLTLTSNLRPLHEQCLLTSWYISCDFQFFLITPFVLILLHRSPRLGWIATLSAIVACWALRLHFYLTNPRAKPLELMRPRFDLYMRNNWDLHPSYIYPHYRIASYLIGLLAGHYTYMVLSGQWSSPLYFDQVSPALSSAKKSPQQDNIASERRRKLVNRNIASSISIVFLIQMMFATLLITTLFPDALERSVKYYTAGVYALDHSIAAMALATLLITMMFGQFSTIRRWMSQPFWAVLSRVSFIIYLIQVELINWIVQTGHQTIEISSLGHLENFLYTCAILYPLSAILNVFFEAPLAQLGLQFITPNFALPSQPSSGQQAIAPPPESPVQTRKNNALANQKHSEVAANELESMGEEAQLMSSLSRSEQQSENGQ